MNLKTNFLHLKRDIIHLILLQNVKEQKKVFLVPSQSLWIQFESGVNEFFIVGSPVDL